MEEPITVPENKKVKNNPAMKMQINGEEFNRRHLTRAGFIEIYNYAEISVMDDFIEFQDSDEASGEDEEDSDNESKRVPLTLQSNSFNFPKVAKDYHGLSRINCLWLLGYIQNGLNVN